MSSKRRNWLWIIFGVFIVLVFLGIGAIIATTAWIQQNLTITETTAGGAQQEFETVRARFAGRPPLLELRDGRPVYAAGKAPETRSTTPVEDLHVLVWDPDEDRIVSVAIPFWFLRLKSGPIEFNSYAAGWGDERVNLSAEDIERHGPGIIMDATSPKGERILLWAQ
jgi:flagellar basal body-associated protein FliL